jgi:hypothetical protein
MPVGFGEDVAEHTWRGKDMPSTLAEILFAMGMSVPALAVVVGVAYLAVSSIRTRR